ncbi:hypothetical protein M441DRAFT_44508 [Trichoderma asperellum CBS 433.97]|uniref:Uncharacterized protein n=1 Tax=Trichoderma asperellum (strain ATCC 204424 / CBS 433.97 / NBRC 101777) TaxID=1042311 RepID=A0A2T3ZI16_TRIA4|nr:hypothetical protein M441DRAFT_44508 [Trichoderma asperellum CBS 433.97]PTB44448.1 hypothetical protein M441DRAFT_44508 [Trichoderma asperellum CBS 433.97]
MLRLKSSSCLAGISSVALASSTGLWSVWSAQFTGLARVPFGAGSEQLKKELIPQGLALETPYEEHVAAGEALLLGRNILGRDGVGMPLLVQCPAYGRHQLTD